MWECMGVAKNAHKLECGLLLRDSNISIRLMVFFLETGSASQWNSKEEGEEVEVWEEVEEGGEGEEREEDKKT